jgi:pyruvate/2-oxoglutarate dehydrogenase complex dihydrolipoamide dehydrogenase (E3) component
LSGRWCIEPAIAPIPAETASVSSIDTPQADPKPARAPAAAPLTPELCVIGAGPAGLAAATAAAALGVPVVLVEKARLGGDGLHAGSVPSKALLAAARRAEQARSGGPFGIKAARLAVEFHEVNDHVRAAIQRVAPNASKQRLAGLGIQLIEGEAAFLDRHTLAVGEGRTIRARRFVIASGSTPDVPAIPGLDRTPYLTTDTVFESRALPKQLIVLGAGPAGLELAQAFRRLGSEVTVLEAATPLAQEDPEAVRAVTDALAREGIAIRTGVTVARVRRVRSKVEVALAGADGEALIEGTDLLVATGRRPSVEGLGLDKAGIRAKPEGIAVDGRLRTSNRRVYAIGDAAGSRLAHLAIHHAERVVADALGGERIAPPAFIPRVTFTDPELAHAGLTEAEARKRSRKVRILRWPYRENDRAQAEGMTVGHIKVVTDRRGTILGATIVGVSAGELIATWTLAVEQRMNIRLFAGIVVPYPTLAEIGKRAAMSAFVPRLGRPFMRRWFGWLRLRR